VCLAVLAVSSNGTPASANASVVNATQNSKLDFTIVNKSGEAIFKVYIGVEGLQDWTENMEILHGRMLDNGTSRGVIFNPRATATLWDIRVVYDMDARGVFLRGVDLARLKTLTITQDQNGKTTFHYAREAPAANAAQAMPISDSMVPRDITDPGYADRPRFLVDVNKDGFKDYCRATGDASRIYFSCILGGRSGFGENSYEFKSPGRTDFGYSRTTWMQDVNGDGRMDFCRQVGDQPNTFYGAILAEVMGLRVSNTLALEMLAAVVGWSNRDAVNRGQACNRKT